MQLSELWLPVQVSTTEHFQRQECVCVVSVWSFRVCVKLQSVCACRSIGKLHTCPLRAALQNVFACGRKRWLRLNISFSAFMHFKLFEEESSSLVWGEMSRGWHQRLVRRVCEEFGSAQVVAAGDSLGWFLFSELLSMMLPLCFWLPSCCSVPTLYGKVYGNWFF